MRNVVLWICLTSLSGLPLVTPICRADSSLQMDPASVERAIRLRVDLLNEIIRDPHAANMKNWGLLADPNDETEISFYANSISDGTASVYDVQSSTGRKVLEHSRSASDPSVVLQYFRLTVMASFHRPGQTPPQFRISSIRKANVSRGAAEEMGDFAIEGEVLVKDVAGEFNAQPMQMWFHVEGKQPTSMESADARALNVQLVWIRIGERKVYGWWY